MILIDCSELSTDERLALASQVSDTLNGVAIALIKGEDIVLDELSSSSYSEKELEFSAVKDIVADFISRRKDGEHYDLEEEEDERRLIVHSADPIAATRSKRSQDHQLPPNLHKCPFCSFVTPYEEEYTVHVRCHFGVK